MRHRLINLPGHSDPRGLLVFGQEGDQVPFAIKRFFAIYSVAEGAARGGHAHRQQQQFLVSLAGAATIAIDDGMQKVTVRLDRPNLGLLIPAMLWLDLDHFTPDAVILVLASGAFSEADYIRDGEEFHRLARRSK